MPTYDYACPHCGAFEAVRKIAQRDEPAFCPHCGSASERQLIVAPSFADMPADRRLAMAVNEKASHEPKLSSQYRHRAGCSCCSGSSSSAKVTDSSGRFFTDPGRPKPAKSFANKRPWMISH